MNNARPDETFMSEKLAQIYSLKLDVPSGKNKIKNR